MKIAVFYATAGEGHKKIAEAIRDELVRQSPQNQIIATDAFGYTFPFFRHAYNAAYFGLVRYAPWLWQIVYYGTDIAWIARLLRPFRGLWNWLQSRALRAFAAKEKPDVIITTHFFAAEVFSTAKRRGELSASVITVITDVLPHWFWVNAGTDWYWVMSDESVQELVRRGVDRHTIRPGGIPIHEKFRAPLDRTELLIRFGLTPGRLTVLFTSGSFGIGPTREFLLALESFGDRVQVMVVCGTNRSLYDELQQLRFKFVLVLMGFVNNMHELMTVADILIAKPGGSTTCESLAKGVPMLISTVIPGQETRNAHWLLRNHAALQVLSAADLKTAVFRLLEETEAMETLKQNVRRIAKPDAAQDCAAFALTLHASRQGGSA